MTLYNDMYKVLQRRQDSGKIYENIVFLADVHYKKGADISGFKAILDSISVVDPLLILIGGDAVDNGKKDNYEGYINEVAYFTKQTDIPIIQAIGNHEYYSVTNPLTAFHKEIGSANYRLEIKKGLKKPMSIVAFNDAEPELPNIKKLSIPNWKDKKCAVIKKDRHIFEFSEKYIQKDSHFVANLNACESDHIVVIMHVPLRLSPLSDAIDEQIDDEFAHCNLSIKTMGDIKKYYRDLWSLVHGHSTLDKNDSTQYFLDIVKGRNIDLIMTGHIHTYYPFIRDGIQFVVSGCGGNNSAGPFPGFPVTKYAYLKVFYDDVAKKFKYIKVDVGD